MYYLHEGIDSNPGYDQEYNYSTEHADATTNTVAGFGRLTWAFTDAFRATGGVRYTWEKKEADGSYLTMNTLCPGAFIPPPGRSSVLLRRGGPGQCPGPRHHREPKQHLGQGTWRGALEYDVTAESMLYASVETGFKSGGYSLSATYPVYQPETITAIHLGSKNRFFDNRLQANLEVFDWDYKNQQISHLAYDANGTLVFPTLNVGHSTIRGAEAESAVAGDKDTLLGADVQYLHSRYDDYLYATPYFGTPPASGCPYTIQPGPPAVAMLNCSGMTPPQSPEWTMNLNARRPFIIGSYKLIGTRRHALSEQDADRSGLPARRRAEVVLDNRCVPRSGVAERTLDADRLRSQSVEHRGDYRVLPAAADRNGLAECLRCAATHVRCDSGRAILGGRREHRPAGQSVGTS